MAEKAGQTSRDLGPIATSILNIVGGTLQSASGILYNVVLFPIASLLYRFIYYIPVLGPILCDSILDNWLERLSADWPDKFKVA